MIRLEHLREALAVGIQDDADARQLQSLQLPRIGEPGHGGIVVGDHLAEIDRRRLDLLVLAELAVAGVEVVEAQALEHLQIAGDGLRIVHGRGDEIVEIDVLDIEGPPHMRAAFFQDLRHRPTDPEWDRSSS